MATIKIKFGDIPSFLHEGQFYRNLYSTDAEDIIEIPEDCFTLRGNFAKDLDEFRLLLRVMSFWMLDDIPSGVLSYCKWQRVDTWANSFSDIPGAVVEVRPLLLNFLPKLGTPLKDIFQTNRWDLIIHEVRELEFDGMHRKRYAHLSALAAQFGNLRVLRYLHENEYAWDKTTCSSASANGHLACLQFAHENGCPWDSRVYEYAAQGGHLHLMKYAYEQGLREWHVDVCKCAALGGHLACLQFVHENGCPWDAGTSKCAAEGGHLNCLRYALENCCEVDTEACKQGSKHGHFECLQLLLQYGAPCNKSTSVYAAVAPDSACLQCLHAVGCIWAEDTPTAAARTGHIATLKYALEQGCPYDENIMPSAVRSSDMTCLQYLVEEQGLHMDESVFKVALLHGDLNVLKYLIDQGCPYLEALYDEDYMNMIEIFRKCDPAFLSCVQYAVERGWVPDECFIEFNLMSVTEPCRVWLEEEGFIKKSAVSSVSVARADDVP